MRPISERFWEKVRTSGDGSCWEWTAGSDALGYGKFGVGGGVVVRAHRFAYELRHGPIGDPKKVVMHTCDNRRCVNIDHLVLGSRADNARDRDRKGRTAKGEQQKHKLTEEEVRQLRTLRALGVEYSWLSRTFRISGGVAHRVVHRQTWKHVA
jgi:hypothetical protein